MSKNANNISLGFSSYGKAINLIFSKGLWWFFLFPVAFNVLLFYSGFEVKSIVSEYAENYLLGATGLNGEEFFLSEFLKGAMSWIIGIVFSLIMFLVLAYFGGYIIIIIMSPILAYLSEKTEKIITGKDYPFSAEQLMRDVVRGILIALRNAGIEFGLFIMLFIVSLLPIIGALLSIIGSIFLFLISSYFYGFSFMDYSNERKRLNISQSIAVIRKHKWLAITNGGIFSLSLLIPFCGVSLAGFFAIISVVAASIAMTEVLEKENKQELVK